jgi:hypothetical protein
LHAGDAVSATTVTTPGSRRLLSAEAVDLPARRARVRRRTRAVDIVGAAARAGLPPGHPGVAAAGAAVPDVGVGYPLHSDPEFAADAGFRRPILHGLCTYGMTCKAMAEALLDGDTSRVASYGARFAGVVFPGETLKASIWKEGEGFQAVVTAPERDDAVALAGVELIPV